MRTLLVTLAAIVAAGALARADDARIVVQKGRAFRPAQITIGRGETVIFTNEDSFIHQIYSKGLFDTEEKGPGQNISETFTAEGTFEVRCHIHPKMRLIVHVR